MLKQIEFQHFRKAPHPFQHYGNFPPTALKNRSLPKDYGSIPQGQEAFVYNSGKKQFNQKNQTSFKNYLFGNQPHDILSKQMAKHNHKIIGKSLQTSDIEGAKGGSLKSQAIKNKQKAQQMKNNSQMRRFDPYDYQKEQYRLKIQNANKFQYQKDVKLAKYISYRGQGHYLNPQKLLQHRYKNQQDQHTLKQKEPQSYLKIKYNTLQRNRDEYKKFFQQIQNQKYDGKFSVKKQNELYDLTDNITQKSFLKQQSSLLQKYKTIQLERNNKKQYELKRQTEGRKLYEPNNYSKKSIQRQFTQQQGGLSSQLIKVGRIDNPTNLSAVLNSSRLSSNRQF